MKLMKKALAIAFSFSMLAGVSMLGMAQKTEMATAEIAMPHYQQTARAQQASEGLEYLLLKDYMYCVVMSIGTCEDTDIVIADTYEGWPVKEISAYAFDCTNLTSVTIPDSVTIIGEGAFSSCESLKSVVIPDSVTSIGSHAFFRCISLPSVTISDSVTSIGLKAFSGGGSLTSIEVDENNANYSSLDGNLYNKDQTELIQYAIGKEETNFTIPDGVKNIGDYAFYNCGSLKSIIIPGSVTSIGESAFRYCGRLMRIAFKGEQAQWDAIEKGKEWNYSMPADIMFVSDDYNFEDENMDSSVSENDGNHIVIDVGCFGTAGLSTCLALMGLSSFLFIKRKDEE